MPVRHRCKFSNSSRAQALLTCEQDSMDQWVRQYPWQSPQTEAED